MTNLNTQHIAPGNPGVLRRNLAHHKVAILAALGFGALVNILALAAPLFALQVYDRVLGSRSEETLLVLIVLLAIALAGMGVLDHIRKRILAHLGLALANALAPHVRQAQLTGGPHRQNLQARLNDVHGACASNALAALLDLPWAPLFLAGLFLFHPMLGWWAISLALAGLAYAVWGWRSQGSSPPAPPAHSANTPSPGPLALASFAADAAHARTTEQALADRSARAAATMNTARIYAQSLTIALAALLVLRGALTPGAILASTVLLARFLAPFDQLGAGIVALKRGWRAARDLSDLPELPRLVTPPATGPYTVKNLSAIGPTPGTLCLRDISFSLKPGQTMGIIGPNGAGKSALLAHLSGQMPLAMGNIVPWPTWQSVVHVPHFVDLTGLSIADIVSGGHPNPDPKRLKQALCAMKLEHTVQDLPDGPDQRIGSHAISMGQMRALALARLAYQMPPVALLDEPFSGLDAAFRSSLCAVLDRMTQAGSIIIMATHHPSALPKADHILVLESGRQRAFGPAAQVLARSTRNVAHLGPVALARQRP